MSSRTESISFFVLVDGGGEEGAANRKRRGTPRKLEINGPLRHGMTQLCEVRRGSCGPRGFQHAPNAKDVLSRGVRAAAGEQEVGACGRMVDAILNDESLFIDGLAQRSIHDPGVTLVVNGIRGR